MKIVKRKGIIAERGFLQAEVAKSIGVCEKTFYNKMKNGVFRTDEAEAMTEFLKIPNPEDIFLRSE